jgi:hypothetical protein
MGWLSTDCWLGVGFGQGAWYAPGAAGLFGGAGEAHGDEGAAFDGAAG